MLMIGKTYPHAPPCPRHTMPSMYVCLFVMQRLRWTNRPAPIPIPSHQMDEGNTIPHRTPSSRSNANANGNATSTTSVNQRPSPPPQTRWFHDRDDKNSLFKIWSLTGSQTCRTDITTHIRGCGSPRFDLGVQQTTGKRNNNRHSQII